MVHVSRRVVFTLYLTVFVDFMQCSFLWPLIPKIVQEFGYGATQVGLLGSVGAIVEGVFAPFVGGLADKFGRRPVFIVAMLGCLVSNLLTALAPTYWLLVLARVVNGVSGSTAGAAGAYLADVTTPAERPRYMSFFGAAITAGVSIGPAIGGFVNTLFGGWRVACYVASAICAANMLSMYLFLPESRWTSAEAAAALNNVAAPSEEGTGNGGAAAAEETVSPPPPPPAKKETALPPALYLVCLAMFLSALGLTSMEAVGVLFVQKTFYHDDKDLAALRWSTALTGIGIVGFTTNMLLFPALHKCMGLKASLWIGGFCSSGAFLGMAFPALGQVFWYVCIGFLVFGDTILGTVIGVSVTLVVSPNHYGKAFGTLQLCGNMARGFGPLMFGPVFEYLSPEGPWYINSGCKAAAVLVTAFSAVMRTPKAAAPSEPSPQEAKESEAGASTALIGSVVARDLSALSASAALMGSIASAAGPSASIVASGVSHVSIVVRHD